MERIYIFTDGSCNPAHRTGAWAAIILFRDKKKVLSGYAYDTTHQRMELNAVIQAFGYIQEYKLNAYPIVLYTDSQYVEGLQHRKEKLSASGFETKKKKLLPNADLLPTLFRYFDTLSITIVKVKSHQQNTFEERLNSEVDRMCRRMVRDVVGE